MTPKCSSQKCLLQPQGYRRMGSPSCSLFFIVATVASVKQPMWHPSPYQVGSHGDHPSPGVDNYQYFTPMVSCFPLPFMWFHSWQHELPPCLEVEQSKDTLSSLQGSRGTAALGLNGLSPTSTTETSLSLEYLGVGFVLVRCSSRFEF